MFKKNLTNGGIAAFKWEDIRTSDASVTPIVDVILEHNERTRGIASKVDQNQGKEYYRMVKPLQSKGNKSSIKPLMDGDVLGMIISGPHNPAVDSAVPVLDNITGLAIDTGVAQHAEDVRALGALGQVAQDVPKLKIGKNIAKGVETTKPFGEKYIEEGSAFLKANKKTAYFTLAAVTAAGIGYKMAKKKNENDQYQSTMEAQPIEQGGRPYGIQEAMLSGKATSRRNPFATAGVVGNLDRRKIGHTKMGSDKNSGLFKTTSRME